CIVPRGLVALVGIDHVACRVVSYEAACRACLQDLGVLAESVACLLQELERLVQLEAGPFQHRVQLASITIIGHCNNLPTVYTGARDERGHKRSITGIRGPAKQCIKKTSMKTM